ncbi:MAG: S8 family serine peptidase [Pseudomonadota bacterium]
MVSRTAPAFLLAAASVALSACESFVLDPPALAQIEADSEDVVDAREIVVLADTRAQAADLTRKANGAGYLVRTRDDLSSLGLIQVVLEIPASRSGVQAIRELEGLTPGVTAGVNHAYRPQANQNARHYAPAAMDWPSMGCRAQRPVGVIDSSVMTEGARVHMRSFADSLSPDNEHGSAVVALLRDPALASDTELYVAAVIEELPDGGTAAGVDALVRAIAWLLSEDVRVVNMSLAGPYNKILDRALQRATDRGALIVAAAGNDGPDAPPRYPAALNDVIAVTAFDAAQRVYADAVRGPHIDIAAPGVDVFIDHQGGVYRSGTSFAAPFVALYFATNTDMPADIRDARQALTNASTDLGAPGRDPVFGVGALKADDLC